MPSCRIEGNRPVRSGHIFRSIRTLVGLLAFSGVLFSIPVPVAANTAPGAVEVPVTSYIVKETGSQNLLMAKDIDRPVSPASLTKILTCLMAIESGRMDDEVVISKEATLVEPTKAGLRPGDRVILRDLVKAAMVNSSNDAAFAIGIHLGGSVESFVASMNSRARWLGMGSSRFTNPAGFDTGAYAGNVTTARDLMLLTEHAVRYPEFNAIARLDRAVFRELSTGRTYSLKTHNKMLSLYPYTVGIKTGFTNRAGKCLIARAVRERKDLLMVMLGAKADRWTTASNMFDRGFGLNPGEGLAMQAQVRRDSVFEREPSARQVMLERERALSAIRQKIARQENSAGAKRRVAVSPGRKTASAARVKLSKSARTHEKKLAKTQDRKNLKKSRVALKSKRATADRVALKKGKKSRTALSQKKKGSVVTKVNRQKVRKEVRIFVKPAESAASNI
ncbi:MAG: D-alanyl-D-alanine carboxypeptidase [Chlorobiaceae bacterium]|nr:D-alanyl-D-alanine carboxypeptidase [Chlorobiaceae bacterium]NTW74447.1 D-alanyl-D-alanine carboxypeptidase [Chlorobiaceae bacterium]